MEINVPDESLSERAVREEVRLELQLWYKRQARRAFQARMEALSREFGLMPKRLIITSPMRRWGSCNYRGEIRLNWRLIMLPPALLDYVITHELCHLVHRNHGPGFWNLFTKLMPDCRERRRELRVWEKGRSVAPPRWAALP